MNERLARTPELYLLALVAPLAVSALQLQIPENPTSGGTITIKWTNEQGDPCVCLRPIT